MRRPRSFSVDAEAGPRAPGRSRRFAQARRGGPLRAAKPPCGFRDATPRSAAMHRPTTSALVSRFRRFPEVSAGTSHVPAARARGPGGSTLTPSATRRSRTARTPPPGPRAARALAGRGGAHRLRLGPPGRLSARGGARRAASRPALRARRRWRAPAALALRERRQARQNAGHDGFAGAQRDSSITAAAAAAPAAAAAGGGVVVREPGFAKTLSKRRASHS